MSIYCLHGLSFSLQKNAVCFFPPILLYNATNPLRSKGIPFISFYKFNNTFIYFFSNNFTVAWHIVACTITTHPFQKSPFFGLQNSIHVCGSLLSEESLFHFTVLFLKLWSCILKEFFVHSIHVYLLVLQLQLIFISWSITKQSQ